MKANALYMEEGEINVGGPESGIVIAGGIYME